METRAAIDHVHNQMVKTSGGQWVQCLPTMRKWSSICVLMLLQSVDANIFKLNPQVWARCSLTSTGHSLNLAVCVIVKTHNSPPPFFLFCPRLHAKRERRGPPSPDMKYQFFISQACHINTGSRLGRDAKRRNRNSVEPKKQVRVDHRGEKWKDVPSHLTKEASYDAAVAFWLLGPTIAFHSFYNIIDLFKVFIRKVKNLLVGGDSSFRWDEPAFAPNRWTQLNN